MEIFNDSSFKMSFKRSTSCHFFIKRKFQVEGHAWMQEIIGHFWWRIWYISKYGKSTLFLQLWLNATFISSIHLNPLFFHLKACNLIFIKHQESCPKTPWVWNSMDLYLVSWNWFFSQSQNFEIRNVTSKHKIYARF